MATTFNQFKYFSSTDLKDLEEKINKFLNDNRGVEIVKCSMTATSWGKHGTWDPVIGILIGYRLQRRGSTSDKRIAIISSEHRETEGICARVSKQALDEGLEVIDILFASYIPNLSFATSVDVLAFILVS